MDEMHIVGNDLLIVSYLMKENGWNGSNKSNFQRVLYFAAALSPIFIPEEEWIYSFSNTIFGPYNSIIKKELERLLVKGFIELQDRKILTNRVEERYIITNQGISYCKNLLFKLNTYNKKVNWFKIIVKVLSIYGENFLSKLVKQDPNIYSQNLENRNAKLIISNTSENLSKEFFQFLKEKGQKKVDLGLQKDEDYLLLFFDILYRKYKDGDA